MLIAHQFVTAVGWDTQRCESETLSLGTLDNVDASVFDGFDYVALGHVHSAQRVGPGHHPVLRRPLQVFRGRGPGRKGVLLVELGEKGQVDVEKFPFTFCGTCAG